MCVSMLTMLIFAWVCWQVMLVHWLLKSFRILRAIHALTVTCSQPRIPAICLLYVCYKSFKSSVYSIHFSKNSLIGVMYQANNFEVGKLFLSFINLILHWISRNNLNIHYWTKFSNIYTNFCVFTLTLHVH